MESLMELFEKIRDIPYCCPESIKDKDYRCWGKNRLLFEELRKRGIETRYRVCEFNWSEQRIPPNITSLAPTKEDKHLFLEAMIDGKWIILDSSNDCRLPSFNNWDGKTDCKIAVKPSKIYSPKESWGLEEEEKTNFRTRFDKYKKFYMEINKFFNQIRKK